MIKQTLPAIFFSYVALTSGAALADCKDQVKELREEINDDRDKNTSEARAEAKKELAVAQAQILSPLECREQLRKARKALRNGKK